MRKVKFFASLTALMTLSVAALTACTTAEASTHHTVSQTGGESVHSSRLDAILERGYIEVATEPSFAPNEFIDTTKPARTGMRALTSSWPTISPTSWEWNCA